MGNRLVDASLGELEERLNQLDEWARALDAGHDDLEGLRRDTFGNHDDPDDDWNDYHRVRSEYDRRAAEEFDLGQ